MAAPNYGPPPPAGSWNPAYVPTISYFGGVKGEDPGLPVAATQPISTANCTNDFTPRSQQAKVALVPGRAGVLDVGRNRGQVAPGQRYPLAGDAALAAPVVSAIAPATAAAGSQPLVVTITGTGFTPYSRVITGGAGAPFDNTAKYLSATSMTVSIDPRSAVAGTASVAVEDHGVLSNTDKVFTFT